MHEALRSVHSNVQQINSQCLCAETVSLMIWLIVNAEGTIWIFTLLFFKLFIVYMCVSVSPIIAYMWRADSLVSILSFYHVSPGNQTRVTCWWEPLPIESSYWPTWIFSKGKFEVLDMCLGLPAWSYLVVSAWLQSTVSIRNTNV